MDWFVGICQHKTCLATRSNFFMAGRKLACWTGAGRLNTQGWPRLGELPNSLGRGLSGFHDLSRAQDKRHPANVVLPSVEQISGLMILITWNTIKKARSRKCDRAFS